MLRLHSPNHSADPVHIFQCKIRIHWQRQNPLADMKRHRSLLRIKLPSIALKRIRQRIEILPCPNFILIQCIKTSLRVAPNSFS